MEEAVKDLNDWLYKDGKDSLSIIALLREYVPKLHSYGIPVDRIFMGCHLIHPQCSAWFWKYESPNIFAEIPIAKRQHLHKLKTLHPDEPLIKMRRDGVDCVIRHRHTDDYIPPGGMTELFREKGYTDLYGRPFFYRKRFQIGVTWATKHLGGFSDEQIAFLEATKPMLDVCIQLLLSDLVTHSLLCAYLGSDPGARVHSGSVDRGNVITVRSVVWFSDVRGFTALSSHLERDRVIDLINNVFEVTEIVLKKHGGEILKFMGDGVLAIFKEPDGKYCEGSTSDGCVRNSLTLGTPVCSKAKAAAAEFQKKLKEMSDKRVAQESPGAEVGIGLHYGDCSYGNVGAESRLDFTVIGPSVNLASRVEGLCSSLGASVLATEEFVQRDLGRRSGWTFRGKHSLKGVMGETPIYELMTAT